MYIYIYISLASYNSDGRRPGSECDFKSRSRCWPDGASGLKASMSVAELSCKFQGFSSPCARRTSIQGRWKPWSLKRRIDAAFTAETRIYNSVRTYLSQFMGKDDNMLTMGPSSTDMIDKEQAFCPPVSIRFWNILMKVTTVLIRTVWWDPAQATETANEMKNALRSIRWAVRWVALSCLTWPFGILSLSFSCGIAICMYL